MTILFFYNQYLKSYLNSYSYMRGLITTFVFLTTSLSAYASDLLQQKMPIIEIMPEMNAEWVAEQIVYNGIPMSIKNFKSTKTVKEVVEFYKDHWRNQGADEINQQTKTIGTEIDGYYYSVQVEKMGLGSEGTMTVTPALLDSDRVQISSETSFPFAPDSQIISRVESIDLGIKSETIMAINQRSVSNNESWLNIELSGQGWKRLEVDTAVNSQQNQLVTFQRGKEMCQVTVIGDDPKFKGSSIILVNWTKGD